MPIGDLHSVVSSECPTEQESTCNRMNIVDSNGCLITNIHRPSDQLVSWLNMKHFQSEGKKEAEYFLRGLGIVPNYFDFNDITNLSWLDASLYICFEKYDLFAVTAELETCKKLKEFLMDDHAHRQNEVDMGGPMRNRIYKNLPFPVKLQFVPLHSQQIFPHHFPLLRRNNDGSDTYRCYIPCNDGLFRETTDPEDTTSPTFSVFEQSTTRLPSETLNIWLVMLNAGSKFSHYIENYGLETLHQDIQPVAQATLEIIDLIYKPLEGGSSLAMGQVMQERGVVDDNNLETKTKMESSGAVDMLVNSGIAKDLLHKPGLPSLSLFHQLSGPERKAICQNFFFGDDDERSERMLNASGDF